MEVVILNAPKERVRRECLLGSLITATRKIIICGNVLPSASLMIVEIPEGTQGDLQTFKKMGLDVTIMPF